MGNREILTIQEIAIFSALEIKALIERLMGNGVVAKGELNVLEKSMTYVTAT